MMRPAECDLGWALFYVVEVGCDEGERRMALAYVGNQ